MSEEGAPRRSTRSITRRQSTETPSPPPLGGTPAKRARSARVTLLSSIAETNAPAISAEKTVEESIENDQDALNSKQRSSSLTTVDSPKPKRGGRRSLLTEEAVASLEPVRRSRRLSTSSEVSVDVVEDVSRSSTPVKGVTRRTRRLSVDSEDSSHHNTARTLGVSALPVVEVIQEEEINILSINDENHASNTSKLSKHSSVVDQFAVSSEPDPNDDDVIIIEPDSFSLKLNTSSNTSIKVEITPVKPQPTTPKQSTPSNSNTVCKSFAVKSSPHLLHNASPNTSQTKHIHDLYAEDALKCCNSPVEQLKMKTPTRSPCFIEITVTDPTNRTKSLTDEADLNIADSQNASPVAQLKSSKTCDVDTNPVIIEAATDATNSSKNESFKLDQLNEEQESKSLNAIVEKIPEESCGKVLAEMGINVADASESSSSLRLSIDTTNSLVADSTTSDNAENEAVCSPKLKNAVLSGDEVPNHPKVATDEEIKKSPASQKVIGSSEDKNVSDSPLKENNISARSENQLNESTSESTESLKIVQNNSIGSEKQVDVTDFKEKLDVSVNSEKVFSFEHLNASSLAEEKLNVSTEDKENIDKSAVEMNISATSTKVGNVSSPQKETSIIPESKIESNQAVISDNNEKDSIVSEKVLNVSNVSEKELNATYSSEKEFGDKLSKSVTSEEEINLSTDSEKQLNLFNVHEKQNMSMECGKEDNICIEEKKLNQLLNESAVLEKDLNVSSNIAKNKSNDSKASEKELNDSKISEQLSKEDLNTSILSEKKLNMSTTSDKELNISTISEKEINMNVSNELNKSIVVEKEQNRSTVFKDKANVSANSCKELNVSNTSKIELDVSVDCEKKLNEFNNTATSEKDLDGEQDVSKCKITVLSQENIAKSQSNNQVEQKENNSLVISDDSDVEPESNEKEYLKLNSDSDSSDYAEKEAKDMGKNYESHDSMDDEEKEAERENKFLEVGELIESSDEDEALNDDYEHDSFCVESRSENEELLEGESEDLDSRSSSGLSDLSQSQAAKEKYNSKRSHKRKSVILDSSSDSADNCKDTILRIESDEEKETVIISNNEDAVPAKDLSKRLSDAAEEIKHLGNVLQTESDSSECSEDLKIKKQFEDVLNELNSKHKQKNIQNEDSNAASGSSKKPSPISLNKTNSHEKNKDSQEIADIVASPDKTTQDNIEHEGTIINVNKNNENDKNISNEDHNSSIKKLNTSISIEGQSISSDLTKAVSIKESSKTYVEDSNCGAICIVESESESADLNIGKQKEHAAVVASCASDSKGSTGIQKRGDKNPLKRKMKEQNKIDLNNIDITKIQTACEQIMQKEMEKKRVRRESDNQSSTKKSNKISRGESKNKLKRLPEATLKEIDELESTSDNLIKSNKSDKGKNQAVDKQENDIKQKNTSNFSNNLKRLPEKTIDELVGECETGNLLDSDNENNVGIPKSAVNIKKVNVVSPMTKSTKAADNIALKQHENKKASAQLQLKKTVSETTLNEISNTNKKSSIVSAKKKFKFDTENIPTSTSYFEVSSTKNEKKRAILPSSGDTGFQVQRLKTKTIETSVEGCTTIFKIESSKKINMKDVVSALVSNDITNFKQNALSKNKIPRLEKGLIQAHKNKQKALASRK